MKDFSNPARLRLLIMPMNIFRALGDMSHLTAKLLMVLKLHASRSAAGEAHLRAHSLPIQQQ